MRVAAGGDDALLAAVVQSLDDGAGCLVPPSGMSAVETGGVLCPAGHLIAYTSGSTGMARGILRTHLSWTSSIEPFTALSGITSQDVVWTPGPLTSTLYLFGAVHAHAVGAATRLRSQDGRDATVVHGVPARLRAVLADPPARLRLVVVAGDHCPAALKEQASRLGIDVLEYYGSAETSFVGWRRGVGAFTAFPGAEVQVREHVIWVRSPYTAQGYVYSGEPMPGPLRREGAWATVGDLGDEAPPGFTVRGRGDAAITVGGHTVVIDDVETILREAAGSDEVAVVGVPHPDLGQVVVAVRARGVDLSSRTPAVRSLPAPARPKAWITVDHLPRTPGGKLDRAALLARARSEVTWTPHR